MLKKNFDLILMAAVIASFLALAAQGLASVPVPDTDESYMLQVSYEMNYRGKLAQPFSRYLGGNIENTLHSFTPVYFVMLSGFLKLFGWGILQGRVFNLITAAFTLVMIFVIGRRMFDWRVGLSAVILVISDITFLYRSRFLRNDYSAAMFALLAFYLYEEAEKRKDWRWFMGSGLAAGAAFMSHTAALYMIAAITTLMLFRRGWRIIKAASFYQFAIGVFVVSAYEIIYDIIDFQNVLLQNHGDNRHFKLFSAIGWLKNLRHETRRYDLWNQGGLMYPGVPRTLLYVFQWLVVIASVYLLVRVFFYLKKGNAISEARFRIFVLTLVAALFFAVVTSQKAIYYMAHLAPLFALAAGILISDCLDLLRRWRSFEWKGWRVPPLAHKAAIAILMVLAIAYGYQFLRQTKRYLNEARNPDAASFEEFKTALRSLVPEGVCPVIVRDPVMWLAFPERDDCFSNIQERMRKVIDIDGKDYALIVNPRIAERWVTRIASNNHHLLGEMANTPYGNLQIYYTGVDPRLLALKPVRYQFFGKQRGHISESQVADAVEVWSATAADLKQCAGATDLTIEPEGLRIERQHRGDGPITLCPIELKPDTIYQMTIQATADAKQWALAVIEDNTGERLCMQRLEDTMSAGAFEGFFRSSKSTRATIALMPQTKKTGPAHVARLVVREIGPVYN
ncbi:MAG: glycosyltransferase family 39 protein [Blastocatellia bacterium]